MNGNNSSMKYRPYLDGLRAVAILSVIACHLDLRGAHGGFVGVDVFFVVSGYLISSIILTDLAQGRFSLATFYERRIRRIFPALFAMLLTFSAVACIFFLPEELVAYARSAIAAVFSASNLYFSQHAGYFDQSEVRPLLHTWSLGVEEQFYLLFPLFIAAVYRWFPKRMRTIIVACTLASLLISIYAVTSNRNIAFYMPQSRAWELLTGVLLSIGAFPQIRSAMMRNLASAAGLLAVGCADHFYNSGTPFPGLSALAPCLGAALMIASSESGDSLVRRFLSWQPMRFTGRISYSLYLWHWPVIVLANMGVLSIMEHLMLPRRVAAAISGRFDPVVEIALAFALAVLSWRYVETPFRNGSIKLSRVRIFQGAAATAACAAAVSVCIILSGGFNARFSPQILTLASYLGDSGDSIDRRPVRMGVCFITTTNRFEDFQADACLKSSSDKRNYLLLGDSHSAVIWSALASALPGSNVMQANTSGCPGVLHPAASPDCRKMVNYIYQTFLPNHHVDGLLLESRWTQQDIPSLNETIAWAHARGISVILFGPVPEYDTSLPRLEVYSMEWNIPHLVEDHIVRAIPPLDAQMAQLASLKWHVPYVSLYQAICSQGACMEYLDAEHTKPLMFDSNHLTAAAAQVVIGRAVNGMAGQMPGFGAAERVASMNGIAGGSGTQPLPQLLRGTGGL
jgi:peptidoglycan/LPS O-acetylase OafA/YrhL